MRMDNNNNSPDFSRQPPLFVAMEQAWEALFNLLPVGVSLLDREGRVCAMNPALTRILDLSRQHILNGDYRQRRYIRDDGTPMPPEDFPSQRCLRENREVLGTCIGIVRDDGPTIWVEVSAAPLPFGEAACVVVTVDVTESRKARKRVEDGRRFVEALADSTPCMMGYWLPDLRCAFANRAYLTWFNRAPDEIIGMPMPELLGPDLFALNEPYVRAVLRGEPQQFERRLIRPSGETGTVWAQYIPHHVDGQVAGFFVIITDVTDLKCQQQLESRERQYRRLAEDMPLYIATFRPDGTLTYVNPELAHVAGFSQNELVGMNFFQFLSPEDRIRARNYLDGLTPECPQETHEQDHVNKDGSVSRHRWTNRAFFDDHGRLTGFQGVGQDITSVMQAEQTLREINRVLEQRVAERTLELDQACDELRQRNRQLRSLATELAQTEDRERRRIAQVLHDNNQQLLVATKLKVARIINHCGDLSLKEDAREAIELLDQCIAASRALTMELAPPIFRDAGMAAGMQWLARWMQEQHGLEVTVECGTELPRLPEDIGLQVFQSIRELLFNVVKHAGVRHARLRLEPGHGHGLCITVSDEGCGFDPGKVQCQADTFGLFSIQERMSFLGGMLDIDSRPGQGSRITLCIPGPGEEALSAHAPPTGGESDAAAPATAQPARRRLLVVDDHAVLRHGLVQMLNREPDLEVVGEAVDGQDALEQALRLQPDLILMDISMPRMNGLEATRRLSQEMPGTRIIGLSMHARDEMAEQMLAAGAVAYLVKSSPVEDILEVIRETCRRP